MSDRCILLAGPFGLRNPGDEALLEAFRTGLPEFDVVPTPGASDPTDVAKRVRDRGEDDGIPLGVLLAEGFPDNLAKRRDAKGEDWLTAGGRGLRLDPDFFLEIEGYRPHQVRLEGGDCSSDSYCFP